MHKLNFFPLGNADCCRIDLDGGQKIRQRNNFSVISGSVVGQDPPLLALGCRKQWPVSRSL